MRARFALALLALLIAAAWLLLSHADPAREAAQPAPLPAPPAAAAPSPASPAKPAPPATPPADAAAAPAPELAELFEADVAPPRELLAGALRGAIETHFPSRKLSSDQLEQLADASEQLRSSREELATLEYTQDNAERRRELVEAVGDAVADFEYILGMTPGEFSEAVQPGVGVSRDDADEPVPAPEFLKDHVPPDSLHGDGLD